MMMMMMWYLTQVSDNTPIQVSVPVPETGSLLSCLNLLTLIKMLLRFHNDTQPVLFDFEVIWTFCDRFLQQMWNTLVLNPTLFFWPKILVSKVFFFFFFRVLFQLSLSSYISSYSICDTCYLFIYLFILPLSCVGLYNFGCYPGMPSWKYTSVHLSIPSLSNSHHVLCLPWHFCHYKTIGG